MDFKGNQVEKCIRMVITFFEIVFCGDPLCMVANHFCELWSVQFLMMFAIVL